MLAAICAWIAKNGLTAVLGALASFLLDAQRQRQANTDAKDVGRLEAERDHAVETMKVQQRIDAVPTPDDDEVLRRLKDGTA